MKILPEITVVSIEREPLKGGTTQPLLATGVDGKRYVLKLFSEKDIRQRKSYPLAEVLGHCLADHFGLSTPGAVLMSIPDTVLHHNAAPEVLMRKFTQGLHFASEYIPDLLAFSPAATVDRSIRMTHEDEQFDIFALDILMGNQDRRMLKPNILLDDDRYWLIDHEKAFAGLDVNAENFRKGFLPYYSSDHLFWENLKKLHKKNPQVDLFGTFEENLRKLNIKRLFQLFEELVGKGIGDDEVFGWLSYLQHQKENSSNFVALIRDKLRE